jgi:hypothetical protein
MSDNLPARWSPDLPGNSRQIVKAAKAAEHTELAVYEHHLAARYLAEVDRIDGEAIAEVVKAALEEELNLLDWGLAQAAGSPAKAELVSRKTSLLSSANSSRISRRFGG